MATPNAPMTELEAVNVLLGTIGEYPVTDLNAPNQPEVGLAQQILGETTRDVLAQGWWFNTLVDQKLSTAPYSLPAGWMSYLIDPARNGFIQYIPSINPDGSATLVRADAQPVTPGITITISTAIMLLQFNGCPQNIRRYIAVRAARIFQDRVLGADSVHAYSEQDEQTAFLLCRSEEMRQRKMSFLTPYEQTAWR